MGQRIWLKRVGVGAYDMYRFDDTNKLLFFFWKR